MRFLHILMNLHFFYLFLSVLPQLFRNIAMQKMFCTNISCNKNYNTYKNDNLKIIIKYHMLSLALFRKFYLQCNNYIQKKTSIIYLFILNIAFI